MRTAHVRKAGVKSGRESAEIRDPVHGYVYANEIERAIIDSSVFQRLRKIRQLAGCHLVYPGGQHTRFEHSIGAMKLADTVADVLSTRNQNLLSSFECQKLRIAALLHDIGHGPFSHVFEEVMAEKGDFTHEQMTQKIILQTEIGDILSRYGISKREISDLSVGNYSNKKMKFENDILTGGLSVDIMDYLLRDSYFTGVEYGKVDVKRIINSFEISEQRSLAIGQAALFAFEALMIARYEMFRAVYFHRTVRAAELMIMKSMLLADRVLNLTDASVEKYLSLSDEVTLFQLKNLKDDGRADLRQAKRLAIDYDKRNLLKCVFEKTVQRKDKFLAAIFKEKKFREEFATKIADEAGINESEIFIDVPTAPSVPISSTRGSFEKVTVAGSTDSVEGERYYEARLTDLPLLGNIYGYMDVIRVYTSVANRGKAQDAARKVFGQESFETRISM